MRLGEQTPTFGPIGLRASLLKMHRDLLRIHQHVGEHHAYYPLQITNVEKMVLMLEDRRFLRHPGFDVIAVAREIFRAVTFRRHGGASTIDMQFVRTATGYKNKTISRKIYETILATIIQYRYSKIVILRSYLSCAFFGSHVIGVQNASHTMFNKDYTQLEMHEAAEIASMLVYPKPTNANSNWNAKIQRRAKYGMAIYRSYEERLDKLKI